MTWWKTNYFKNRFPPLSVASTHPISLVLSCSSGQGERGEAGNMER
jgi:hypothetical protein